MKELIIALISFTLGYFTAITDVQAQTQYFYGPNGNSAGTSFQSGNTTYFYGPNGNSAGTAFQSGNATYFYGPNGNNAGTTFQSGAPTIPLYVAPIQPVTPMFNYTPIR